MAVFWLSASAAWANGVINMKHQADPNNWIFNVSTSICKKTAIGELYDSFVRKRALVKYQSQSEVIKGML